MSIIGDALKVLQVVFFFLIFCLLSFTFLAAVGFLHEFFVGSYIVTVGQNKNVVQNLLSPFTRKCEQVVIELTDFFVLGK